jgi:Contractile injection system tube protein
MGLEHATIVRLQTREVIRVEFNPEEYALEGGSNFAEFAVAGLPVPPVQYTRGSGRTLRVELLFDSSQSWADVRLRSARVAALTEPEPATQAPPVLAFLWGPFAFRCVLEKLTQRFTRFTPGGVPVRVYQSATFKEYAGLAQAEVERGLFVAPPTVRNMAPGGTLSQLAADVFGDPAAWRAIAEANGITDPRRVPVGLALVLPPRPRPA